MADLSIDLRERVVAAYREKRSGSYAETARLFGIGEATVSRLLRRYRETGDLRSRRRPNNPRRVDLVWLQRHLDAEPDARIVDRIEAWRTTSGRRVGITTMWMAIRACGWTHKKRRWSPGSRTGRTFARSAKPSSLGSTS